MKTISLDNKKPMQLSISFPIPTRLDSYLKRQSDQAFSYNYVGATQGDYPLGYSHDHTTIFLGSGENVWQKAKLALQNWQQFPPTWTNIYSQHNHLSETQVVAVLFRLFGIWWINSARIIYTFDESNRFGLAYGTLPGHVEEGEEVFWLERNDNGEVFYHIDAFSKPAYWFVWLAYPIARAYQRKFQRDSMARMKKLSN